MMRREKLFSWFEASALGLFEVSQCGAAGRRNPPAVGYQTMRNPFAIRNELAANRLGVLHAGLLVLHLIRRHGDRRDCSSKQTDGQENTKSHL
jgi:hypothetical protein